MSIIVESKDGIVSGPSWWVVLEPQALRKIKEIKKNELVKNFMESVY